MRVHAPTCVYVQLNSSLLLICEEDVIQLLIIVAFYKFVTFAQIDSQHILLVRKVDREMSFAISWRM